MGIHTSGIDEELEKIKEIVKGYEERRLIKHPEEFWYWIIIPKKLTNKDKRKIQNNFSTIKRAVEYGMKIYLDEKGESLKNHPDDYFNDYYNVIKNLREIKLSELKKLIY